MRRALEGLRRYQEAARPEPGEPMPAIASARGATLRDYGGEADAPAVLFVPSLINPPNILDLGGDRSLLRWLARRGHRPMLVDWGWEIEERRGLSIAGHIETILLPLIDALAAQTGRPPILVGYCLGGTMAIAAAARTPVRAVATIAAPWRFSAYPEPARALLASLWAQGRPTAERLGVFPMELLQIAFWSLDPARTIAKFERFATLAPESEEARGFVQLEDWANDGPPIGEAAARDLFEGFFADDLPGSGRWEVAGGHVDPAALSCPFLNIVSATDRIVPAASVASSGERRDIALGHVGMVVGGRGPALLWEPLSDWLFRTAANC